MKIFVGNMLLICVPFCYAKYLKAIELLRLFLFNANIYYINSFIYMCMLVDYIMKLIFPHWRIFFVTAEEHLADLRLHIPYITELLGFLKNSWKNIREWNSAAETQRATLKSIIIKFTLTKLIIFTKMFAVNRGSKNAIELQYWRCFTQSSWMAIWFSTKKRNIEISSI